MNHSHFCVTPCPVLPSQVKMIAFNCINVESIVFLTGLFIVALTARSYRDCHLLRNAKL